MASGNFKMKIKRNIHVLGKTATGVYIDQTLCKKSDDGEKI
jgi:hypothetical protein